MKKEERQFLFGKCLRSGLSYEKAGERVNKLDRTLKDLVEKLRSEKMSERDINEEFRKEFSKMANRI